MKPADFYDLTPRQFFNKLAGFHLLEQARQKEEWERARFGWSIIANWSGKVSKQNLQPKDLFKFPWDQQEEKPVEIMSRERFEQLKNKYN